jgi:hypothetical protein
MPLSKQKQKDLNLLKEKAYKLYEEGFSLRAVGNQLNRSYEWVRQVVKHKRLDKVL